MSLLEELREEINELVRLVRLSERYLTSIAANPKLASDATHAEEIAREVRIGELRRRLGVTS